MFMNYHGIYIYIIMNCIYIDKLCLILWIYIYTQNIHEYILYLDNCCFLGSNGGVNFAPWWHHSVHPVFTPCSPDRQRSFQFGKWRARTRQNLGRWTAAGLRSYRRRPHLMLLIAMLHLWWIYLSVDGVAKTNLELRGPFLYEPTKLDQRFKGM